MPSRRDTWEMLQKVFALNNLGNKEARKLLKKAIGQVATGMDMAASELFRFGKYHLDFKSTDGIRRVITPDQLTDVHITFILYYPVMPIRDSFDQEDWDARQTDVHS
ncbi:Eno1 [Lemmus lemmus]